MFGLIKRYLKLAQKVKFMALRNGFSRAEYLRRNNSLRSIGSNVYYYSRILPSDPKLLSIGNNVTIATNVRFLGHDRIDIMLSGMTGKKYSKFYGCIDIEDNVFIGSDVVILPGVKIGNNSIIGAGAVVTKDLPSGFVWGGVPARPLGEFQTLIDKRIDVLKPENDPDKLWEIFYESRKENECS